ncbi:MAG: hypothetical protein AB7R69_01140 [Candidatus Babeliales bacterium]
MQKKLFLFIILLSLNGQFIEANRRLGDGNYGTHMAPLMTVVANTKGPILELGSGDYSTPLLHAVCSVTKRFLLTTDTDKRWLSLFIDLARDWHHFSYIPVFEDDWAKNPKPELWDAVGTDRYWSVVFVDHRPGDRRRVDIERLRHNADIFVVHDTEEPAYGYEPVLATFKYRYTYLRYAIQTTIVSDTIDIRTFFE